MIPNKPFRPTPVIAHDKLLETAVKLIRTNGYSATSVDQLCGEAVVTKGAFFHHLLDPVARVLGRRCARGHPNGSPHGYGEKPDAVRWQADDLGLLLTGNLDRSRVKHELARRWDHIFCSEVTSVSLCGEACGCAYRSFAG